MQAIRQSSRVTLFVLLLVVLAGSFALLAPKPVAALTCGPGSYMGLVISYYTDSTFTKVSCVVACASGNCAPTPYRRTHAICCPIL
jgi:hypothetical protein